MGTESPSGGPRVPTSRMRALSGDRVALEWAAGPYAEGQSNSRSVGGFRCTSEVALAWAAGPQVDAPGSCGTSCEQSCSRVSRGFIEGMRVNWSGSCEKRRH